MPVSNGFGLVIRAGCSKAEQVSCACRQPIIAAGRWAVHAGEGRLGVGKEDRRRAGARDASLARTTWFAMAWLVR